MKLRNLFTDDSAVSPVVGVILMVAITVLLAATAASFFLGLTNDAQTTTPTTSIAFDYDASSDHTEDALRISHTGGDSIAASQVDVTVQDAVTSSAAGGELNPRLEWSDLSSSGSVSEITAGSSVTISADTFAAAGVGGMSASDPLSLEAASVKVTWKDPDSSQSFVLAEWSAPTAG